MGATVVSQIASRLENAVGFAAEADLRCVDMQVAEGAFLFAGLLAFVLALVLAVPAVVKLLQRGFRSSEVRLPQLGNLFEVFRT